jgi:dienelactone hydrolase
MPPSGAAGEARLSSANRRALTLCDERHMPKPPKMQQIRGPEASEVAMKNDPADLDRIDEAVMTCDLSDEALEAAARVDGGRAMTVGYCATASNAWYCMPF